MTIGMFCLFAMDAYAQSHAVTDDQYGLMPYEATTEHYDGREVFHQIPDSFHQHPEFGKKPYNCKVDSAFELIHKRTINTRTLVKKGTKGRVIYKQKVYGKFHYQDENGWWRTIDPRLKPTKRNPNIFKASQQPVPVTVDLEHDYTSLELIDGFEFKFNRNTTLKAIDKNGQVVYANKNSDRTQYKYGSNGVINFDFWPNIDREVFTERGNLKTNFVLNQQPSFLDKDGFLVIEDSIALPDGFRLQKDASNGYHNIYGDWQGKLQLIDTSEEVIATIDPLKVFDQNGRIFGQSHFPAGYQLEELVGGYKLQIRVAGEWLHDPKRSYPVRIDPLVQGSDTFRKKTMGFKYDPFYDDNSQGGLINFCPYYMTVKVPGKSELVQTAAEFESQSFNGGCPSGSNCEKEEVRFRLFQPCDSSLVFFCNDIDFLAGRCTTLVPFVTDNQMACLDPKCPPHYLDFELRLYHGSCQTDGCDTVCHKMFTGTWIMTVKARTLEGNISAKAPYCKGDTIQLKANADWGVPPYQYLWLHNGDTSKTTFAVPTTDSTFVCRIRDSCSLECDTCGITVYDTIHMVVRENPDITLSSTDAFCSEGTDGSISASGSGTQGPYQYVWNTNPPAYSDAVDSVAVGTYHVTVTDRFGCDTEDSVEVGYENLMEINAAIDSISCFQANDGAISLAPSGTAPFLYEWSTGERVDSLGGLAPGTYVVTVTDDINCFDVDTFTFNEPPPINLDAGLDLTIIEGESVQLQPTISPADDYLYIWSPPEGLSDTSVFDPMASPDSTTIYTVTAFVAHNENCWAADSLQIEVLEHEKIFVPTAFSPNGDGINDLFVPKGEAIIHSISVYDRWGNRVYKGTEGWDGYLNGQPLPIGTYVYAIRYQTVRNGEVKLAKGNVTLLR